MCSISCCLAWSVWPWLRCACGGDCLSERIDPGQLPIQARVVEPVPDHEAVGDDKTGEVDVHRDLPPGGPVQQRRQAERGRLVLLQLPDDDVDGAPGVDDVLAAGSSWTSR